MTAFLIYCFLCYLFVFIANSWSLGWHSATSVVGFIFAPVTAPWALGWVIHGRVKAARSRLIFSAKRIAAGSVSDALLDLDALLERAMIVVMVLLSLIGLLVAALLYFRGF